MVCCGRSRSVKVVESQCVTSYWSSICAHFYYFRHRTIYRSKIVILWAFTGYRLVTDRRTDRRTAPPVPMSRSSITSATKGKRLNYTIALTDTYANCKCFREVETWTELFEKYLTIIPNIVDLLYLIILCLIVETRTSKFEAPYVTSCLSSIFGTFWSVVSQAATVDRRWQTATRWCAGAR